MMSVWLFAALAHGAEPTPLEAAYQKEYAFLLAEKDSLQARQAALGRERAERIGSVEAEISRLEGQWLGLQSRGDQAEDALNEVERNVASIEDARGGLDATLHAASTTLDVTLEPERPADALAVAYERGVAAVAAGRATTSAPGSFFLRDGTAVDGTVVRVGRVAAYGVSPQGSGALVPVGEGRLQIWRDPAGPAAEALASGTQPDVLPIYLFERIDQRIEEPKEKGLQSTLDAGGPIGYVILALGAFAALLLTIRGATLLGLGRGSGVVVATLAKVERDQDGEAARLAAASGGAVGRVLAAVVPAVDADEATFEGLAEQAIGAEMPALERFGTAISVIAAVAPLLGLLGTVTGMISTFDVITEHGTGDPKMLSSGIGEALVTTEFGLIVAIPSILLGNLLGARARTISDRLDRAVIELQNVARKRAARPADDTQSARIAHG